MPKAEMVSVEMVDDDTVEITGKVISPGAASIDYTGFSYSRKPDTGMENNQTVLEGTEGTFKTKVKVLTDSVYYFRCFAVNDFGYGLSAIKKFEVPHPQPKIAPCLLQDNKIVQSGITYPISYVYSGKSYAYFGTYGMDVSNYQTGGPRLRIDFNKIPTNGIYFTNADNFLFSHEKNPKEVYIRIDDSFTSEAGDSIFVSETPDGKLNVSFCNLRYNAFNTQLIIKAKFSCNK